MLGHDFLTLKDQEARVQSLKATYTAMLSELLSQRSQRTPPEDLINAIQLPFQNEKGVFLFINWNTQPTLD